MTRVDKAIRVLERLGWVKEDDDGSTYYAKWDDDRNLLEYEHIAEVGDFVYSHDFIHRELLPSSVSS